MKEKDFQAKIQSGLKIANAMVLNIHGHAMQAAGWPDLYVCHWRWKGWIELKVGTRQATPLQRIKLRELSIRNERCCLLKLITDKVEVYAIMNKKDLEYCGVIPWEKWIDPIAAFNIADGMIATKRRAKK